MHLKWTFGDNLEDCLKSLDHLEFCPSHFRTFSSIIGQLKETRDGPTDGQTLIEMRGRILKIRQGFVLRSGL